MLRTILREYAILNPGDPSRAGPPYVARHRTDCHGNRLQRRCCPLSLLERGVGEAFMAVAGAAGRRVSPTPHAESVACWSAAGRADRIQGLWVRDSGPARMA